MSDAAPEPVLLVHREGSVATLTLNRPKSRNALDPQLVEALRREVPAVVADESVRAVVLTGNGGSFCAGADLKSGRLAGEDRPVSARLDELHEVLRAIVSAPKAFVAAIDGPAVGFGCDLALACDLRVMSTRAYLQEIFVKIGLMPDGGGTFWMPRLVGLGRALEYLLLGTRIHADLAREVGLTNRVVEPGELAGTARELALALAKGPPLAQARIKRAVRENAAGTIHQALERERESQIELLQSEDLLEGVLAWAQKRDPDFRGK
jgi:2-(1,2-epoxy-1,2-dihydrophenyl)acetyl-CoA isomerase